MKKITVLEGAVLGTIWREAPITSYAVLALFNASLTSSWNASTGSIYPAIRRLKDRGLIKAARRAGDGRATHELSVTKAGVAALKAWINDIDGAIGTPSDPLRVRMQFLGLLSAGAQRRWVDDATGRLAGLFDSIEEELARIEDGSDGDPIGPRAAWVRRATQWLQQASILRHGLMSDLAAELGADKKRINSRRGSAG